MQRLGGMEVCKGTNHMAGTNHRHSRLLLLATGMALALSSCGGGSSNGGKNPPPPPALTFPGALQNAAAPLVTPTYDGSGQTVEPTVLYFANGWHGHKYWMVVSPYPESHNVYENPSVLVSEDGQTWDVPAGLTNPIALPSQGNFADGTVAYDAASDQLWVYFLHDTRPQTPATEDVLRMTSSDGIHWSAPETVVNAVPTEVNSATVIQVNSTYDMWSTNTGTGCTSGMGEVDERTSTDGVHWSAPTKVTMSQDGYVIWHMNVIYVPSLKQYMSVFAAYPNGTSCNSTKLFFANSYDGITWQTYSTILIDTGTGWDSMEIYRSSPLYDDASGRFRVWYSARDTVQKSWHTGYSDEAWKP